MFNKTSLSLGSHVVDLSTIGTKVFVPTTGRPTLGALALYSYKTAVVRYVIENPGAFSGMVKIRANNEELPQAVRATSVIVGDDRQSGEIEVDLTLLQGQSRIEMVVEVATAGSAAARVWASMDIEYANAAGC